MVKCTCSSAQAAGVLHLDVSVYVPAGRGIRHVQFWALVRGWNATIGVSIAGNGFQAEKNAKVWRSMHGMCQEYLGAGLPRTEDGGQRRCRQGQSISCRAQ